MTPKLKLSKLDCAKRQLETAIELYFLEKDPVSTHTLASAAHQILRDLNSAGGGPPMLFDKESLVKIAKPGMAGELYKLLGRAEAFFKHADRDHDEVLDFNPISSESILWECSVRYSEMTGETPDLFRAMGGWFRLKNSQYFDLETQSKISQISARIGDFSRRYQFYQEFMRLLPEMKRGGSA